LVIFSISVSFIGNYTRQLNTKFPHLAEINNCFQNKKAFLGFLRILDVKETEKNDEFSAINKNLRAAIDAITRRKTEPGIDPAVKIWLEKNC
jgi:hypothetical protein